MTVKELIAENFVNLKKGTNLTDLEFPKPILFFQKYQLLK